MARSIDDAARSLLQELQRELTAKVWLVDVDDTLVDTIAMHDAASASVEHALVSPLGREKAAAVVAHFNAMFHLLVSHHQRAQHRSRMGKADEGAERQELESRINACQVQIRRQWGTTKKLSREVLVKLAGEDCEVDLGSSDIEICAEAYWAHLENHPKPFADAVELVDRLENEGIPLFLITSSDARFVLRRDGQFSYDPPLNRKLKTRRIDALGEVGIRFDGVFIGDPVDKPTPEFFDSVRNSIQDVLGRELAPKDLVVLGDSYNSDIETPSIMWPDFVGLLYQRGEPDISLFDSRVVSIGDLRLLAEYLAL